MKIKNILTTMLFVIVMILSIFVGVGSVEAAVVNTNTKSEEMYFDDHVTDCDSNCGSGAKGTFSFVLNKTINIFDENGNNKDYSFTLEKDKIVNLDNGTTTGYWYLNYYFDLYSWKKRVSSTELMDGIIYKLYQVVGNYYAFSDYSTGLSIPIESTLPELTSGDQGILECNGTSCRAIKNGTTTITVSFPIKTQSSPYSIYGTNLGYGKFNMTSRDISLASRYQYTYDTFTYSFPSITYTINVPPVANTPQVSACTGTTNITKDSATVNWSYTDDDPLDVQTQYQVQLSTKSYSDPSFSTSTDVVFSSSSASSVTNHTFTGLTASTTYYSRIRTYNATNGWSGFSSCSFGFTTLVDNTPPSSPICLCNGTRTLTCTTNGVATTTTPNHSSCALTSYCSVATTTTTTTFTFGPASNRIGSIRYDHSPGITSTKNGPDYTYNYQIPKVNDTQSLTVTLTDSDGGSDTRTCSVNNSITPIVTTPTINILKSPRISLNKNSKCKLDWDIENMPEDTTCELSGFSTGASVSLPFQFDPNVGPTAPNFINSWTSGPLQQNTKYTISCSGPELTSSISKSAICRVNPTIGEI